MELQTDKIIEISKIIGNTLKNPEEVKKKVSNCNNKSMLGGIPWEDTTLTAGYPSLVVFFSELDNFFPNEGWDLIAHEYLLALQDAMITKSFHHDISLFSGLTGIAFAVRSASKNETRYSEFLEKIDCMVNEMVNEFCDKLAFEKKGISPLWFDIISGLSGAGRYLLQVKNKNSKETLQKIDKCLISMGEPIEINYEKVMGWYVPNVYLFTEHDKKKYPEGVFNLGMAHGVAGFIAYLSLSGVYDINYKEKKKTIECMCDWLLDKSELRNYGLCWPSMISLQEDRKERETNDNITRDAWCYGSAGIGRALFLAGKFTERTDYVLKSKAVFKSIYSRTMNDWRLEGPSFCHGYSGLLQIINRMYMDTKEELYFSFKEKLIEIILEKYDANYPFGFVDEEGSNKVIKIGLLDGVAGIILTLISTIEFKNHVITWDYPFLLA